MRRVAGTNSRIAIVGLSFAALALVACTEGATHSRSATKAYGQTVKISGTVYFPNAALKNDNVDFDCGLSNPLIELTS